MTHSFDGHANCFVESGHGKALLLDFNYDTEPLTGTFPLPGIGPMTLLEESRANHLGKLAFRHVYWNLLLPGRPARPARRDVDGRQEPRADTQTGESRPPCPPRRSPATPSTSTTRASSPSRDQWDDDLGAELARLIGIELTDDALEARPLPARRLRGTRARPPPCAGQHPDRRSPSRRLFDALPRQAGQEDGLRRRAAQAEGMCVMTTETAPTPTTTPFVPSFDDARVARAASSRSSAPRATSTWPTPGLILANAALGEGRRDAPVLHLLGLRHDQQEDAWAT